MRQTSLFDFGDEEIKPEAKPAVLVVPKKQPDEQPIAFRPYRVVRLNPTVTLILHSDEIFGVF
jgi:hypothetical protein